MIILTIKNAIVQIGGGNQAVGLHIINNFPLCFMDRKTPFFWEENCHIFTATSAEGNPLAGSLTNYGSWGQVLHLTQPRPRLGFSP